MDIQTLINVGATVMLMIVGGFVKRSQTRQDELEARLHDFQVQVARDYATNNDLSNIDRKLDRILERLDSKADK